MWPCCQMPQIWSYDCGGRLNHQNFELRFWILFSKSVISRGLSVDIIWSLIILQPNYFEKCLFPSWTYSICRQYLLPDTCEMLFMAELKAPDFILVNCILSLWALIFVCLEGLWRLQLQYTSKYVQKMPIKEVEPHSALAHKSCSATRVDFFSAKLSKPKLHYGFVQPGWLLQAPLPKVTCWVWAGNRHSCDSLHSMESSPPLS